MNISFFGGIHYGLAASTYDVARDDKEKRAVNWQFLYSFVPAIMSYGSTNVLLFSDPLTIGSVIYCFTSLMLTQLVTLKFDHHCVKKELAPLWFKKYRSQVFAIYMTLTTILFGIFYSRVNQIHRKNDPNRITNLKNALELED